MFVSLKFFLSIFYTLSVTVQNSGKVCSSIFVPMKRNPFGFLLKLSPLLGLLSICLSAYFVNFLSDYLYFLLNPERTPIRQVCKLPIV